MDAVLQGVLIGLSVAVPVGPMGLLCISRTLNAGLAAGIATGAGACTMQAMYCTMLLTGLRQVEPVLEHCQQAFTLLGVGLMFLFAWRLVRRAPGGAGVRGRGATSVLLAYASALALNAVNPLSVVLLFGALTTVVGPSLPQGNGAALLVGGLALGSLAWWVTLSTATATLRRRLDRSVISLINLGMAGLLALFGAVALARMLSA